MRKQFLLLSILSLGFTGLTAQEVNFTVKVNGQKATSVDPKVFATLENTIQEFLNSTKWTEDVFETEERINCNLLLTISEERSATNFKADLAIQSSRPVYGVEYETPMFNHLDKEVTFDYEQYQPLQFSKNLFQDNLSSVLAYYVYIVIGLDYDSFSLLGGEPYFKTAQEIVNTVPENVAAGNPGWRSQESNRNRYWFMENLLSPRVRPFRQGFYNYHRLGLDVMYKDPNGGRAVIAQTIEDLGRVNQSYPNAMIVLIFNNTKNAEIVEIFKGGTLEEKNKLVEIMGRVDPTRANAYRSVRN